MLDNLLVYYKIFPSVFLDAFRRISMRSCPFVCPMGRPLGTELTEQRMGDFFEISDAMGTYKHSLEPYLTVYLEERKIFDV